MWGSNNRGGGMGEIGFVKQHEYNLLINWEILYQFYLNKIQLLRIKQ